MIDVNLIPDRKIRQYSNSEKVRQASVAIVIRGNVIPRDGFERLNSSVPIQTKFVQADNLEVLFIQRAFTERDPNSGEIAFPGGKNDDLESDLQAAIRETKEEVGLDLLTAETYYLTQSECNVYMRKSSQGQNLYCSYHVFLINDPLHQTDFLKVSKEEVADYKWVSFEKFLLNPSCVMKTSTHFFGPKIVKKYFKSAQTAAIDIGMKEILYGMTFFFTISLLKDICTNKSIMVLWHHAHKSSFKFSGPYAQLLSLGAQISFRKERISIIDPFGWPHLIQLLIRGFQFSNLIKPPPNPTGMMGSQISEKEIEKLMNPLGFLKEDEEKEVMEQISKADELRKLIAKFEKDDKSKNVEYQLDKNGMPPEVGFKAKGLEPTRYGDWIGRGRVTDF